jgi:hypothetical protein
MVPYLIQRGGESGGGGDGKEDGEDDETKKQDEKEKKNYKGGRGQMRQSNTSCGRSMNKPKLHSRKFTIHEILCPYFLNLKR